MIGKDGQVGWELARCLSPLGDVVAMGRKQCDLARPESIKDAIYAEQPDIIINAAAYTAVDQAETEPEAAIRINGEAVGELANIAKDLNACLFHYSTDYIFNGSKKKPYVESDTPDPINLYGLSKLKGEQAIRDSGCSFFILRTSWVYSSRGSNFVKTIVRLAREKRELNIVSDQWGCPTWARNIADATAAIICLVRNKVGKEQCSEILNLASEDSTNWYEFALEIANNMSRHAPEVSLSSIQPIGASQYETAARRPENSRLDTSRIKEEYGLVLPSWRVSLSLCMNEIYAE